jgi:hypothetical protein
MRWSLGLAGFLLIAAPLGTPAGATGFLSHDLGAAGSADECIDRARRTLDAYATRFGRADSEVVTSQWTSSAFSVEPGGADINIACPYRDFRVEIALITVHSLGPVAERETILDRLLGIWATQGQGAPLSK